ncbi:cadherin-like domain-containing protein [Spirosoma pulveris]
MKNHYPLRRYLLWVFSLILLLSSGRLLAQQSSNTVKYRVTYSTTTQRYTVWVVPDYATPNSYNGGSSEFSSTAQVTLKVPIGFVIQNILDASGTQSWEKAPAKLGPGLSLTATTGAVFTQDYSPAVLDPNYAYYVIGKAPTESNLGPFVVGVPVALFTFSGNGCSGPIQIMPPGDPFIQAAYDTYSYNVPNSFYSSSGQPSGGNQDPLEQFIAVSGASADCQPPQTPTVVITGPAMGTTVASLNPPISGTATPGSSVTVTGPNGQSCIITAAIPSGTWTCTSLTFVNGPASVTAITSLSGVTGTPAVDNFIINVPGSFAFNCTTSSLSGSVKVGTASSATLMIGITNATAGPVSLTLSGTGFASVTSPVNLTLTAGQTSISIPLSYDGSGPAGVRTLSVSSAQATGSCSVTVSVANINAPTVVITGPAMGTTVASLNPPISGTATPGSSVTVTGPNGQSCITTAAIPSGTWTCTSLTFVNGPASVTAITSLSGVTSTPAVTNFTVAIPQPPLVRPDSATTLVGVPVSGNVVGNDTDPQGGTLTASLIGLPTAGTVTMSSTGNYTFTPPANFTGVASFCYSATNTAGLSASTCVSITVVAAPEVNLPPVALNDQAQTPMNQPVVIGVLSNDSDPNSPTTGNGQLGKPTLLSQPASGTALVNANGTVTYIPPTSFTGAVSFAYRICDQATAPLCATALVSVTVVSSLKPPVAVDDSLVTNQNTAKASNVSPNDYDPQSLTMIYSSGQPQHGVVVMAANGIYTYTPADGYTGPDSFTYSVCNIGFCSRATVYITVRPLPIVTLRLKVLLQGALVNSTGGLMRDDLRSKKFLPLREPYSAMGGARFTHVNGGGGETMPASVTALNAGTGDAVVDWVFVELRNPANMSAVVTTRSALVQRDGDVVLASDGVSPLSFSGLTANSYYVSVKHRNHLGVMTATAVPLSTTGTLVDFTTMTSAQLWNTTVGSFNYEGWEQITVGAKQAMWAGDASYNGKVKYQGANNDLITIFSEVIAAQPGNPSPLYNYDNALGYYFGDVNMDGKVKYQGTTNDTSLIFTNVISNYQTPSQMNSGQLYNFDFMLEQIP